MLELTGVEQFKPFFGGEVYLDAEVFRYIVLVLMYWKILQLCIKVSETVKIAGNDKLS